MKFKVEFSTDNDAFADGSWGPEVGRILEDVAYKAQLSFKAGGVDWECAILDSNGNRIGRAWTED